MTHFLAQVRLKRSSGLSTDIVVNNFHFIGSDTGNRANQATAMQNQLNDFYNTVPAGGPTR